ncbi:MAG: hydrogenobyrinic acid a,c-diamide synthase (glutamine-hydrolyzing) [Gammaproteobacteria bacterium]|jgi:cobyrinic acid a,c-diamide synthase
MGYFYLSAAHKSSGKTTLSIGLCAAFAGEQGMAVQPFKKGPDFIDPLWLAAAAGRPCFNLDVFMESPEANRRLFQRHMAGADIGIIEGNKGLFDGLTTDGSDSNATMAGLLGAPVILVIDTRGMTRGIAPLLHGYATFDAEVEIAGVILNQVGGGRHESKLRNAVETYTDIPVLGAVWKNSELVIDERHLGLMPSNEHAEAQKIIGRIAAAVSDGVDLALVRDIAGTAPAFDAPDSPPVNVEPDVTIGIPRDAAFGFYYAGDLLALREAGACIVWFDAIEDKAMPDVDGLFIGGGFPETLMHELEANRSMRDSIREFAESGGPVYAECGGLMYLCRSIRWGDRKCEMAGIIAADVVMDSRPQGRGYVRVEETASHPWPTAPQAESPVVPAHEFHYSHLDAVDPSLAYAYRVKRGHGIDGINDGIVYKNVLASYTHLRDVEGHRWARRFVEQVRHCKRTRG